MTVRRVMQFTKRFAPPSDVTTPFMVCETSPFVIFRVSLALIYFYNTLKRYGQQITWFLPAPFLGRNSWLDHRIPNLLRRTLLYIKNSIEPFPPSLTQKKKCVTGILKEKYIQDSKMARRAWLVFFFFLQSKWSVL